MILNVLFCAIYVFEGDVSKMKLYKTISDALGQTNFLGIGPKTLAVIIGLFGSLIQVRTT